MLSKEINRITQRFGDDRWATLRRHPSESTYADVDLQRDTLVAAGVDERHLFEDRPIEHEPR